MKISKGIQQKVDTANDGMINGGGTGIRTLDGLLTHAGFQDRCFRPLSHPSV